MVSDVAGQYVCFRKKNKVKREDENMVNMDKQQNYGPVPDSQDGGNKALAALAYPFWIVGLIGMLVKKDSAYVKFHAIQGMALAAINIILSIIMVIIGIVLGIIVGLIDVALGTNGMLVSLGSVLTSGIGGIVGLVTFVLMILGIINAVQGTMKPLPIIGEKIDGMFNK